LLDHFPVYNFDNDMVRVFIKYLFVLCAFFAGSLSSVSANASEIETQIFSVDTPVESFSSTFIFETVEQSEFHSEKLVADFGIRFVESEEDSNEESESFNEKTFPVTNNYFSSAWAAKTCTFCLQNVKNQTLFYKIDSSLTKKWSLYLFFEVFRI
jgi:hypothetical protein